MRHFIRVRVRSLLRSGVEPASVRSRAFWPCFLISLGLPILAWPLGTIHPKGAVYTITVSALYLTAIVICSLGAATSEVNRRIERNTANQPHEPSWSWTIFTILGVALLTIGYFASNTSSHTGAVLSGKWRLASSGLQVDETEMPAVLAAVKKGDPYALYLYAGTLNEDQTALKVRMFEAAGKAGVSPAWFELGVMFCRGGPSLERDPRRAIECWTKAAEKDHTEAQAWLAWALEEGIDTKAGPDWPMAAKWYGKAARDGYAAAQLGIGRCYREGRGVPQDYIEAYAWLNLAAMTSPYAAQARDEVALKLSSDQIVIAQGRTRELAALIKATPARLH